MAVLVVVLVERSWKSAEQARRTGQRMADIRQIRRRTWRRCGIIGTRSGSGKLSGRDSPGQRGSRNTQIMVGTQGRWVHRARLDTGLKENGKWKLPPRATTSGTTQRRFTVMQLIS